MNPRDRIARGEGLLELHVEAAVGGARVLPRLLWCSLRRSIVHSAAHDLFTQTRHQPLALTSFPGSRAPSRPDRPR